MEGTRGADCGAGPALKTAFIITMNGSGNTFSLDIESLEIGKALLDVLLVAPELKDHYSFVLWQDSGLENIEFHVELPDKLADNGLINDFLGKFQYL